LNLQSTLPSIDNLVTTSTSNPYENFYNSEALTDFLWTSAVSHFPSFKLSYRIWHKYFL
jgi:hypothetical protein